MRLLIALLVVSAFGCGQVQVMQVDVGLGLECRDLSERRDGVDTREGEVGGESAEEDAARAGGSVAPKPTPRGGRTAGATR